MGVVFLSFDFCFLFSNCRELYFVSVLKENGLRQPFQFCTFSCVSVKSS